MGLQDLDRETLEKLLRKVVAEELSRKAGDSFEKYMDPSGVGVVKIPTVKPKKFDTGNPNDKVYLTDVFTIDESKRLSCGVMEMEESAFDWTLNYDEIDEIVGNKGEAILIPKGSKIQFSAPKFARFLYVIYPADWQEKLEK